jgi:hypothetical protein
MNTQRYETDLTDEQFALIEPFLRQPKRTGRPPADLRSTPTALSTAFTIPSSILCNGARPDIAPRRRFFQ